MTTTGKESIREFLEALKEILGSGGRFFVVPREKNKISLLALGLTYANCKQELLSLNELDYCSGPDVDPEAKGDVWVFGKEIEGRSVYIKVRVTKEPPAVTCISFHEAEYRLKYIYK